VEPRARRVEGAVNHVVRYVGRYAEWACRACQSVCQAQRAPEDLLCPRCARHDAQRQDELLRLLTDVENLVCDVAFAAEQGDRELEDRAQNDLDAALRRLRARLLAPRAA
jgi:hypothetical protein